MSQCLWTIKTEYLKHNITNSNIQCAYECSHFEDEKKNN